MVVLFWLLSWLSDDRHTRQARVVVVLLVLIATILFAINGDGAVTVVVAVLVLLTGSVLLARLIVVRPRTRRLI